MCMSLFSLHFCELYPILVDVYVIAVLILTSDLYWCRLVENDHASCPLLLLPFEVIT